jgi:hypothetical protein
MEHDKCELSVLDQVRRFEQRQHGFRCKHFLDVNFTDWKNRTLEYKVDHAVFVVLRLFRDGGVAERLRTCRSGEASSSLNAERTVNINTDGVCGLLRLYYERREAGCFLHYWEFTDSSSGIRVRNAQRAVLATVGDQPDVSVGDFDFVCGLLV